MESWLSAHELCYACLASGRLRLVQGRSIHPESYKPLPNFLLFFPNQFPPRVVELANESKIMRRYRVTTISLCGVAALAAGCAERQVEYVPAYQAPPVYGSTPAYNYQSQTAYQSPPAQMPAAPTQVAPAPPPTPDAVTSQAPASAPPGATVVTQAPPAPQVEVLPVAPGPAYVWAPGYWSWSVGGWVWVGGHYIVRP